MDFLFQSRDPAVQAAILAQLNAKYGSGALPDAPKEMSKASTAPEILELDCRPGPEQATPKLLLNETLTVSSGHYLLVFCSRFSQVEKCVTCVPYRVIRRNH